MNEPYEDLVTMSNIKETCAKLSVKLMNPEAVETYLTDVGEFASVCYDTDTCKVNPEAIAKQCIRSGHMSPARAVYFIFKLAGIDRSCSHQIVRHRYGVEINQRSQRYCDESKPSIVIPDSIIMVPEALEEFIYCENVVYNTYKRLKKLGIPGDDARSVLSNCTETEMNIAFTPQALIHFCNERCCSRASQPIRWLAMKMREQVCDIEPYFTSLLTPKCSALGYCPEASTCGRMPTKKVVLDAYRDSVRSVNKDKEETHDGR